MTSLYAVPDHQEKSEIDILREQLDEARKTLQEFVYCVSHDLGAPLRAVTSFSGILQNKYAGDLDERGQTYMNFVNEGGARAQEMVQGLLSYSRVTTQGKPFSPTGMDNIINIVCNDLEARIYEAGAEISYDLMPVIWADTDQMKQLFTIAIDNALTYRQQGSHPNITVRAEDAYPFWRFSIIDDGIGIPEGKQAQAFQIFKRLHPEENYPGLGMGLALARRIVERHGGDIGLHPARPRGTILSFTLPQDKIGDTKMPLMLEAPHA